MQPERARFQDQVASLGFVQIPVVVLRDSRLSAGAILTYATLLMYARQDQKCWPGTERLGMDRGVSRRSITNHLSELKGVMLISTERRPGTSQVYWIMPMWTVYGQEDAHHRFTEETLKVCNLNPEGKIPRNTDVKVSKAVKAAPPVSMGDVATGLAVANKRTEERRVERGKKTASSQAAKVDKKLIAVEKETSITPFSVKRRWAELYREKWPNRPEPVWSASEAGVVTKLLKAYEAELVMKVCERVIVDWEECAKRWNLDGVPTIKLVWGFRETLFAEVAEGKAAGGQKSESMRADEFAADGEALDTTGW
jgi:hypothetical protein